MEEKERAEKNVNYGGERERERERERKVDHFFGLEIGMEGNK